MYQEEMSEIFRERNPELNCEKLILYTETMFERMPFMEKCTWMSKAEDDRNRFMHEMEQYRPSSGYDMNGNLIEAVSPVKSKSDENSKAKFLIDYRYHVLRASHRNRNRIENLAQHTTV